MLNSVYELFLYYIGNLHPDCSFKYQIIIIHSKWLNSSIWPLDRNQTDPTSPGVIGPGSNGISEELHIPQSYRAKA